MPTGKENSEKFITVTCVGCHKVLLEVSDETTGKLRKKCPKCKAMRTISLPLVPKKNNLSSVGALALA